MSKNKLTNVKLPKSTLVNIDPNKTKEKKPHIGITYLDKNHYGFQHFINCVKGDKRYLHDLESFIEKCRRYESLTALIESHQPHGKGKKNADAKSIRKLEQIKNDYNIEPAEMIHLHALTKGNGEFVLHGFTIQNIFEIVWLDCKHEVHK